MVDITKQISVVRAAASTYATATTIVCDKAL